MRLGVRVGQGCARVMDEKMRGLDCRNIQVDELWGFIQKKKKNLKPEDDSTRGDVWTFCAIDADSKLVPSYKVGKRDSETANAFMSDLAGRLKNRIQLSSDSLRAYAEAVELAFGADVDYGQIVKTYERGESDTPERRYSPAKLVKVYTEAIMGDPRVSQSRSLRSLRTSRRLSAFTSRITISSRRTGLSDARPHRPRASSVARGRSQTLWK
jgi:IS1 family transposase